jgi:AcrR family transcriptional regulator
MLRLRAPPASLIVFQKNENRSVSVPRILSEKDVAEFRDRLCEVAARLFVERGPDGFHMRELASALGVSAMMPYRYFKDRDEILSVVRARAFRRFADQLEKAHATEGPLVVKSASVGRAYVQFALEEQTNYRLMFDISQPPGKTVPELENQERRARALMSAHVHMLVQAGTLEGDADLIARVLWAALHGVIVLHLSGKLDGDAFDRVLSETMRVISNAYRPVPLMAEVEIPPARQWPKVRSEQLTP